MCFCEKSHGSIITMVNYNWLFKHCLLWDVSHFVQIVFQNSNAQFLPCHLIIHWFGLREFFIQLKMSNSSNNNSNKIWLQKKRNSINANESSLAIEWLVFKVLPSYQQPFDKIWCKILILEIHSIKSVWITITVIIVHSVITESDFNDYCWSQRCHWFATQTYLSTFKFEYQSRNMKTKNTREPSTALQASVCNVHAQVWCVFVLLWYRLMRYMGNDVPAIGINYFSYEHWYRTTSTTYHLNRFRIIGVKQTWAKAHE